MNRDHGIKHYLLNSVVGCGSMWVKEMSLVASAGFPEQDNHWVISVKTRELTLSKLLVRDYINAGGKKGKGSHRAKLKLV